ncbi:MAG: hypothetical protein ACXWV3_01755 [Flavisolibacter sp.]
MAAEKKLEMNEYRLVAVPDQLLVQMLKDEQQKFFENFNCSFSPLATPSFELARFSAKPQMEATLSRWIGNICALQASEPLQVINYSAQPPQSIYLRVNDDGALAGFFRSLKMLDSFIISDDCPPVQVCHHKGILLADGLTPGVFELASSLYARKTFNEYFTVEKILLLRREYQEETIAASYLLPLYSSVK